MSQPLRLSYNWQLPVVLWTSGALLAIALLVRTRSAGWVGVALAIAAVWAIMVGLVYLRARAYLKVDGRRLTVRRYARMHTISGSQVLRVSEFLTASGPCHRLTVTLDSGTARYTVATALLKTGHSTFFGWLLSQAPQAELDKGSRKTLEQLRIRGLLP
jgi:hypothetical protein